VRRTEDGSLTEWKIQFCTSTLGLQDTVLRKVYTLRQTRGASGRNRWEMVPCYGIYFIITKCRRYRVMGFISLSQSV